MRSINKPNLQTVARMGVLALACQAAGAFAQAEPALESPEQSNAPQEAITRTVVPVEADAQEGMPAVAMEAAPLPEPEPVPAVVMAATPVAAPPPDVVMQTAPLIARPVAEPPDVAPPPAMEPAPAPEPVPAPTPDPVPVPVPPPATAMPETAPAPVVAAVPAPAPEPAPAAVLVQVAPVSAAPPDVRKAAETQSAKKAEAEGPSPQFVLAQYVRQTLRQHPQIFELEAESRASESRVGEARESFKPRLTLSTNFARERQNIDSISSDNQFKQSVAEVRVSMPLYDKGLTAQLDQRVAASIGSDWRLTDVREQLMLRTVETYIELARNTNLVKLAQDNLKTHRQYVSQIKDIAQSDLGRASDLPSAIGRVALAQSVLTGRLGKLESVRVSWRQLTGLAADAEFVNAPQVNLPETVDAMVEQALEFNPVLQLAHAEVAAARRGIEVAKAPFVPRVSVEVSSKTGTDWGGVLGAQTTNYAGISLEWAALTGASKDYSVRAAQEGVIASERALDRVRDELRARVEQTWFELQASDAALRSYEDYARNAELMVESTKNQFKIGRKSLVEVLNAESELFTARSNIESTLQDLRVASWRLHSLQGRLQAELGI